MALECRGGRVRFAGRTAEAGGCLEFCEAAVRKLAGMSRRVFHTPESWVFVMDEGMAEVEERLFVDACRVSGPREVLERVAEELAAELGLKWT